MMHDLEIGEVIVQRSTGDEYTVFNTSHNEYCKWYHIRNKDGHELIESLRVLNIMFFLPEVN